MLKHTLRSSLLSRFFYGNLKDSDRIFTNVYKDGDPYINGALKRVLVYLPREIGTEPRTSLPMDMIGLSTRSKHQACAGVAAQVSPQV